MKIGIISPRLLIRRALSTLVASTGAVFVVLEGNTILENLEEIKHSQADTLIVDMCGPSESEALSGISRLGPGLKVLILIDNLNSGTCVRALRQGAWGCLSTRHSFSVFRKALNAVARGERWTPQRAASLTIEEFLDNESPIQKVAEDLTPREWEVLGLLANGYRNKEISSRLSISEETAKSHVKSIYRKLKIKGRRNAIFRYFEQVHRLTHEEHIKVGGGIDTSHSMNS